MKITIRNSDLDALLGIAKDVCKTPDPIKIIAERFDDQPDADPDTEERPAEAGRLRIIAFSENMVIEATRPAEIKMNGSVAIRPDGLSRLVRASKASDSTFVLETVETSNSESLRLNTSRSAHEFSAVSDAVFETVIPGRLSGARTNMSSLSSAISTARISTAARGDAAGGRVMFTGVHIRQRDGLLDIVGADGRRMSVVTLQISDLGGLDLGQAPNGITIPPESFSLMTSMLSEPACQMAVHDNNIIIEVPEGSLSARLIDAPYPDYSRLLDQTTTHHISLPASALEIALQRSSVAVIRDKRSVAAKLTRGADGVYITSSAAGQTSSECVSETPGEDVSIGFDASYMINAISAFGQADITLAFEDDRAPIFVTSPAHPEIRMLVMPCRTN